MKGRQKQAFGQAMANARREYRQQHWSEAFAWLEQAHILGQRWTWAHTLSHWWMLRVGWQRRDWREIRGQLIRIPAALLMSRLWVPAGNTGGSNVSPIQAMPIPESLKSRMELP